MARALELHCGDVIHLGPESTHRTDSLAANTYRANKAWLGLTGNSLFLAHNRFLSRRLGKIFASRIRDCDCDVIFAPVASIEIAHLQTDRPIVYLGDASWDLLANYYSEFSSLSRFGLAEGERIEAAALAKSSAVVYPSTWAIESVCGHYKFPREAAFLIAMGANLDEPPSRPAAIQRSLGGTVNLLMVGVDWVRKGGQIAFDCLIALIEKGIDAQLTVCGCVPPASFNHPNLRVIPRLDKREPDQMRQLSELYEEAHFMLFPTRKEAFGIVICEASAHGLPSLVANTGGVGGALRDGCNGLLLPYDTGGDAYANQIAGFISDPERYASLVISCRDEYERKLNWDVWGKQMSHVFDYAIAHKGQ